MLPKFNISWKTLASNAYVVYKTCYLGAHIKESGWTSMSGNCLKMRAFWVQKHRPERWSTHREDSCQTPKPQNLLRKPIKRYWQLESGCARVSNANFNTDSKTHLNTGSNPNGRPIDKSLTVKDSANSSNWSIQSNLRVGDTVFGDRTYKFVTIPNEFLGSEWIRTACDSKNPQKTWLLYRQSWHNRICGLDSRVATIPSWLNDWTKTSLTITDDGSPQVTYNLYKKNFSANSVVTLGPNGASSGAVNYIVIVKQNNQNIVYGDLNGDDW